MVAPEAARADRAHVLAMHELMVHVEEILVHEGVVAGHLAIEPPRLVIAALRGAERAGQAPLRQCRVARENEDQPVHLADGIGAHPIRHALPAEVWHIDAFAAAVVRPAVVVALQAISLHYAEVQRHLAVRAAIFERDYPSARATKERDGVAREPPSQYLSGLELIGPSQGIPIVGIGGGTPQVDRRQISGSVAVKIAWSSGIGDAPICCRQSAKITPFGASRGANLCDRYAAHHRDGDGLYQCAHRSAS